MTTITGPERQLAEMLLDSITGELGRKGLEQAANEVDAAICRMSPMQISMMLGRVARMGKDSVAFSEQATLACALTAALSPFVEKRLRQLLGQGGRV